MNSVHESGPNGDSKTSPSQKPGQKTKPGERAPSWPSWHAQARAWPRAGGRILAGSRSCRGQGPVVSWAPQRRVVACARAPVPRAPAPCLDSPAAMSQRASGRIASPAARRWPCRGRVWAQAWPYRGLSRDTLPSLKLPSCRNTLYCIAMQFQPNQTVVIQSFQHIAHLSCNTNSVLQYNPSLNQPPWLQYKLSIAIQSTSHNTIWAVALPNF